jgi:hypothetical protein
MEKLKRPAGKPAAGKITRPTGRGGCFRALGGLYFRNRTMSKATMMMTKKKLAANRLKNPQHAKQAEVLYQGREWHDGGEIEVNLYAKALRKAARALLDRSQVEESGRQDWDVCPVILIYRQALELSLKCMVAEGSKFLKVRTDPITLSQTHSLRWLAQIVCQVIKTVGWQKQFQCDGVRTLADFSVFVNDVEALDPVTRIIRSTKTDGPDSITKFYRGFDVVVFARKMDALLDLLDVTADGLAAEWDLRKDGVTIEELMAGVDFKSTIH